MANLLQDRLAQILFYIQSAISSPVAIFDMDWNLLGATTVDSERNDLARKVAEYRQNPSLRLWTEVFRWEGQEVCRVVVDGEEGKYCMNFILHLIALVAESKQTRKNAQLLEKRTMLINQLANLSQITNETNAFLRELGYDQPVSRIAVLFHIPPSSTIDKTGILWIEQSFSRILRQCPGFREEDIYGPLTENQYLVCKACGDRPNKQELALFASRFIDECKKQCNLHMQATIGTSYPRIEDLRNSYNEALFLLEQRGQLSREPGKILFLDAFPFEYLSSLMDSAYCDTAFRRIDMHMHASPLLESTAAILSANSYNLCQSAQDAGIHRNSFRQRYEKLKQSLQLDPIAKTADRMFLRSSIIHRTRKLTLHVGIVIQPHSVLHQGMRKLAETVEKESKGLVTLNIHTISNSGDNDLLFQRVCQGALDFFIGSVSVLDQPTGGRSSVLELPFLFNSYEEANQILQHVVLPDIDAAMTGCGAKCLAFWSMGWRYITSREKPIEKPEDFKDMRFRIMFNNTMEKYCIMLGAKPVKMHYNAVGKAFEMGLIDGQENPPSNILDMGFVSYQHYITIINYSLSIEGCFISQALWNSLSSIQREIVSHSMESVTEWMYPMQDAYNKECLDLLTSEKGLKPIFPGKEEQKQWKKSARPLYETFKHQELLRKIEKAKKAYERR